MNRFDMLADRHKNKPEAYRFKQTNSPAKVFEYIKICMEDNVAFDANNIYSSTIDQALSKLQKEIRIPIITKSEKSVRMLNLSAGLKKVYTLEALPEDILRAVCYWDLNVKDIPKNIEVALTILRKSDE